MFVPLPCRISHQQFDTLIDMGDGIDVEQTVLHRLNHLIVQNQLLHIGHRDDHTLISCKAPLSAQLEKALDLMGHAADGLNLTSLVYGTGHCQILPDGQLGQRGENAIQLRAGGTVAVNAVIVLLEANPAGKAQGEFLGVGLAQKACDDLHALVMTRTNTKHFMEVINYGTQDL